MDPFFERALQRRSLELERQFPAVDNWHARAIERRNQPVRPPETFTTESSNQLKAARIFGEYDFDQKDWEALKDLWTRESRWDHTALNPNSSARGIPQAMGSLYPETMVDGWLEDPEAQIRWGLDYISNRYGTPSRALERWLWRKENDRRGGWY